MRPLSKLCVNGIHGSPGMFLKVPGGDEDCEQCGVQSTMFGEYIVQVECQ